MNHRELLLSASKKARFAFLSLPEGLQDEIIAGLDGQTLTLQSASALVKERGHSLSHEGIAGYYRALRTERRLLGVREEMSRIIAEYAKKPHKEALESLVNLAIATAATGLVDGSTKMKIDLAALVKALPQDQPAPVQPEPQAGEQKQSPESGPGLSEQAAEEIRKKVLGIR